MRQCLDFGKNPRTLAEIVDHESSLVKVSLQPGTLPIPLDQRTVQEALDLLKGALPRAACQTEFELISRCVANSPYLMSLVRRYPLRAAQIAVDGFSGSFDQVLQSLMEPRPAEETEQSFSSYLREQKNLAALIIGLADLSGAWSLGTVTSNLSKLACACLELSIAKALRKRMHMGDLPWPQGCRDSDPVSVAHNSQCGFFILGLGKLGAGELNYSSDIDLIALYDPARVQYSGRKSIGDCFIKLTQDVVRFMDQRTLDGYVFRVDLRLRPDPGATPVALSVDAAIGYYHSIAANWERSAMIKASFAAGDPEAAEQYLSDLSSWIWRKNMDFEALNDIGAIKNQINRHFDVEDARFAGFDVKLGLGGIREIEFYAQINQLLHAGRNPSLRQRETKATLAELAKLQLVAADICRDLVTAYDYLRKIEHRIQMTNDEQTHSVPEAPESIERLSLFAGYRNSKDFNTDLCNVTDTVKGHYDNFLPDSSENGGTIPDAQLGKWLKKAGFANQSTALEIISGWKYGRYRALKTNRARILLSQCLPELLAAFSEAHSADSALVRFDNFLEQLPAGVQLFSLLQANPTLLGLLARVITLAPALASMLAKNVGLWDTVLSNQFFGPCMDPASLRRELEIQLSAARDYQDILDITRRFASEQKFRTGVLTLEGIASTAETGVGLSDMADACLAALIPYVEKDFAAKHGSFAGMKKGIAILALGKYGGRELTHTSDLDIVFLYDGDDSGDYSDGPKPLSANVYYTRLAQHIITAITALTPEGRLFDIDTRLRPSGNQGPLAVSIRAFDDYYKDGAWVWEFMALTRARTIYGPTDLVTAINLCVRSALERGPNRTSMAEDVLEIREKLAEQFTKKTPWDVKHARGGLVDIEFICQFLALGARESLDVGALQNTNECLHHLYEANALDEATYKSLVNAYQLQRTLQALLRLCLEKSPNSAGDIPNGLTQILLQNTYFTSKAALESGLAEAQRTVFKHFNRLIT